MKDASMILSNCIFSAVRAPDYDISGWSSYTLNFQKYQQEVSPVAVGPRPQERGEGEEEASQPDQATPEQGGTQRVEAVVEAATAHVQVSVEGNTQQRQRVHLGQSG